MHPDSVFAQQNHDLDLGTISSRLQSYRNEIVYVYVVRTCQYDRSINKFFLSCNAPNIEGGYISLTSCKHWMRSFKSPEEWLNNFWIAGLTSTQTVNDGLQHLFFLMKIGYSFGSFKELWDSPHIPDATKDEKDASQNILGDFYRLKPNVKKSTRPLWI